MSPEALRDFARTVLRLADGIDQSWVPEAKESRRPFFSEAARIRRMSVNLSLAAIREERRAAIREDVLGSEYVGVPVWSMLLELFKQSVGDAKVSTKSLQIISKVPETTALRMIDRLEEQGLVNRSHCSSDRRVTFVSLTRAGFVKVGSVLERVNV